MGRENSRLCRSDIFVTIRAGRAVYIGPPLAGIAAEMPLLHFHRGRNAVFLNPLWRVFVFLWSGFFNSVFLTGFCMVTLGLVNPKDAANVGSVLRALGCYGADGAVVYTGTRYDYRGAPSYRY